jgi:hypothetical protein
MNLIYNIKKKDKAFLINHKFRINSLNLKRHYYKQ